MGEATCISEVTSAISRLKMGPNEEKVKSSTPRSGIEACQTMPRSPTSPILDITQNHLTNTVRCRMINSSCTYTTPSESKNSLDLQIPIVGYEVMEERARFTVYKLRVQNNSTSECWFVFRRYTDFVRLHSKIKEEYPGMKLPLPRKRWFGDNFDPTFLDERIKGLQDFVNEILQHPNLCQSSYIKDFFCLDEPPSYTDSIEESRAIFETLEETIYNLRTQLREKEMEISKLKYTLNAEAKKRNDIIETVRNSLIQCDRCSKLVNETCSNLAKQVAFVVKEQLNEEKSIDAYPNESIPKFDSKVENLSC